MIIASPCCATLLPQVEEGEVRVRVVAEIERNVLRRSHDVVRVSVAVMSVAVSMAMVMAMAMSMALVFVVVLVIASCGLQIFVRITQHRMLVHWSALLRICRWRQ